MNVSLKKVVFSQFAAWVVIAVAGLWYLFTFDGFRPHLRDGRINFGIDLVGGTYITLDVQVDKAIEAELQDKMDNIKKRLSESPIGEPTAFSIKDKKLLIEFPNVNASNQALDLIKRDHPQLVINVQGTNLSINLNDQELNKIKQGAVKGNIDVLNTRLNAVGVSEINPAPIGEKNIVIELPNVDDPAKAKAMIGKSALLEIKLVENVAGSEDELLDEFDGELPDDLEIVSDRTGKQFYLVSKYADVTGRLLKDAYAGISQGQGMGVAEIVVNFEFKDEGGEKFYQLTSKNPGRLVAIIVDNVVISAPQVNTAIRNKGFIHGNFTKESAEELGIMLKSGAFVAPVTFEEERQIGPSLGRESIQKGLIACLVGLGLLVIFSISMYSVSGFFAFLALLLNLLFILIALSWLRATLTLPGIAGMVLTVGMAIDASILVFERIREELASGVTPRKAVQRGFKDAMAVILDSNITTFIVGIVLYKFGAGPIQGFAVTMMVGIISTLITGLFFLRSIFNFVLYNLGVQKIRI